jgi:hypothetical protein
MKDFLVFEGHVQKGDFEQARALATAEGRVVWSAN